MKAFHFTDRDRTDAFSRQMRRSFLRKRTARMKASQADSPNEYAEDRVQDRAEDIAYAAETTAGNVIRTIIRSGRSSATVTAQKSGEKAEPYHEYCRSADTYNEETFGAGSASQPDRVFRSKGTAAYRESSASGVGQKAEGSDVSSGTGEASSGARTARRGIGRFGRGSRSAYSDAAVQATVSDDLTEFHIGEVVSSRQRATAARETSKAKKLRDNIRAVLQNNTELMEALAGGVGIVVVLAVFILLIGAVGGSPFGIFFSTEETGEYTIRTAMRELSQDYTDHIEEIKAINEYDELEFSGTCAAWRDVLAVFAIKCALDSQNPTDVATMTPEKAQRLSDVFWDMNELSSEILTRTETEYVETEDEEGNPVEEEVEITIYTLSICVYGKSASEMADQYSFRTDQRQQLSELLSSDYSELWTLVLYGIPGSSGGGSGDGDIVSIALSQVGNRGGEPYWNWYGFSQRVEWCACFVSWCANEAGYIENGIIPMFCYCPDGASWFRSRGQWVDRFIEPMPGYIIFYDWEGDGEIDHVGIVESCEGGAVHTIEGNMGDACGRFSYRVGSSVIAGYGTPDY